MLFRSYVSRHGHGFIDRALYLPQAWTSDPARMAGAHVPPDTRFATKPALALALIDRARAAGVPFAWVAADTVYGTGEVERALRHAGKGYVLGVSATSQFNSWGAKPPVAGTAAEIAAALDPSAWHRLSAGAGRGPAARASGYSTGLIWNWPTSRRPNTTRPCPVFGPEVF